MTLVVVQLMKAAAVQTAEKYLTIRNRVLNELKHLFKIYLNDNLALRTETRTLMA